MTNFHKIFPKVIEGVNGNFELGRDVYNGKKDEYFVWNFTNTEPTEFADDEENEREYGIQLHAFLKMTTEPDSILETVREAMVQNGFEPPREQIVIDDKSGIQKRHITWETYFTETKGE